MPLGLPIVKNRFTIIIIYIIKYFRYLIIIISVMLLSAQLIITTDATSITKRWYPVL